MQENPYAAPEVDPEPAKSSFSMDDGPREWTVWGAIGVGFRVVREQPVPLIGGFFLVSAVQYAVQAGLQTLLFARFSETFQGTSEPAMSALIQIAGAMGIAMPVLAALGIYFAVGQFRAALAGARGDTVELGMFFSGFDRILPALGLSLLIYFGVTLGMLLFIIPGIVLALGWSMAFPLVADTSIGVVSALGESWTATQGSRLRILGLFLANALVAVLGILALYIGLFVAIPVIMVAYAEVYMCLTGRRSPEGMVRIPIRPAAM